jgi:hypothetical protein
MVRLVTYLIVLVGSLGFSVGELLLNYNDYVGNSPTDLTEKYQRVFLFQRNNLLLAEFGFPLLMVVALLLLLIFKFASRSVRIPLAFVLFLSAEFWVWRSFFFKGRMADLYLQSKYEDPFFQQGNLFIAYLVGFMLLFVLVVLVREYPLAEDQDALHERLRRSLSKSKL